MAMDSGFRASGELAYSWGNNRFQRTGANPGTSEMGGGSPVPFVGLAHTFPSNFAVGASLAIPYATGGSESYRGSNAYFSRRGSIVAAYGILSAAYAPSDRLSFGLSVAGVSNTMSSISDLDTVPDLHTSIADMGEEFGVSRERIRQLEKRLIDKLRQYMQENMVDFEYYAPSDEDD